MKKYNRYRFTAKKLSEEYQVTIFHNKTFSVTLCVVVCYIAYYTTIYTPESNKLEISRVIIEKKKKSYLRKGK